MSLLDALLLDVHRINVWVVSARSGGIKGSGSQSDPYNGGTADLLDGILANLPPYTTIHLGPGIFKTRGLQILSNGTVQAAWNMKRGWKIVGSGIDVTALQLYDSNASGSHYYAVSHDFASQDSDVALADYAEISELTIDCNTGGAGTSACGAVRLKGSHTRIRRVKAVNWGTQSAGVPCYAIAAIISDPESDLEETADDAGIEECVALAPYDSSAGSVTAFYAGALAGFDKVKESFGRAPYIRRCYVDATEALADTDIRALAMNACAAGVVEGNEIHHCRVGGPFAEARSIRSIIVRANAYCDVANGPLWDLGRFSAAESVTQLSRNGSVGMFTSGQVLNLVPGDRIKVIDASGVFDGVFQITQVNGTVCEYSDDRSAAGTTTGSVFKLLGLDKAVVESNTIELRKSTAGTFGVVGVQASDPEGLVAPPPFSNLRVDIKGNHIRNNDGALGEGHTGEAIRVVGIERLQVQDNVVSLDAAIPIREQRSGHVTYFNNRRMDGTLIRGFKDDTDQYHDELETDAEDALVLALINKR